MKLFKRFTQRHFIFLCLYIWIAMIIGSVIWYVWTPSEKVIHRSIRSDTTIRHTPKIRIYSQKEIVELERLYKDRLKHEGFRDTVYHYKNHSYIYYGHQRKSWEYIPLHQDSAYADSLLKQDVIRAWKENKQIYELNLYKNCKSIFMSGKIY